MKAWKKAGIILLAVLWIFPVLASAAPADEFPHAIWEPMNRFEAAFNAGDDWACYEIGKELISIMEAQPDSHTKTQFLAGKYEQFIHITERLGMLNETLTYLNKYLPYGEAMGWEDGVTYARRKIKVMTPEFQVFTERAGAESVYYGAKFEPHTGCYYGSVYNNDPRIGNYDLEEVRKYYPRPNSVYLIYLEFGDDVTTEKYQRYFKGAQDAGAAVLLAWQTYTSMSDIMNHQEYITQTLDYLGSCGRPVFLRFANEMNIGPNGDDPAAYIQAFRYIADQAHQRDNIAVVWSPNDVSNLERPFENFYPGDQYVDWVGVSSYIIRYFAGVADHGDKTDALNTYFYTGDYANPVVRLREITSFMQDNNIQKPLMITEGGVPHYLNESGQDTTDWALVQLRRYYGELIRTYPQLKSICYFNVHMPDEANDYALHDNPQMEKVYNEVVENEYYITQMGQEPGFSYVPFGGTVTEPQKLSAVAYYPKATSTTVKYYLDGQQIYNSDYAPYQYVFEPDRYSVGPHTFTARLFTQTGEVLRKDYAIDIQRGITVQLNGQPVTFEGQAAVQRDDRTLIPVRGVFEQMGYEVNWNGALQTASITDGKQTIEVPLHKSYITHNGKKVMIDVPAQLINDRTMVPLRAITETLGAKVEWDEDTLTVMIRTK